MKLDETPESVKKLEEDEITNLYKSLKNISWVENSKKNFEKFSQPKSISFDFVRGQSDLPKKTENSMFNHLYMNKKQNGKIVLPTVQPRLRAAFYWESGKFKILNDLLPLV